jgi:hypothetical protein
VEWLGKRAIWIACVALALSGCFVVLLRTRREHTDALAPTAARSATPPKSTSSLTSLEASSERVADSVQQVQPTGERGLEHAAAPVSPSAHRRVSFRGLLVRPNDTTFERAEFERVGVFVVRTDENGFERTPPGEFGEASFTEVDLSAGIRQPISGRFEALVDLSQPPESVRAELVLIVSFGNYVRRERACVELPSELPDEIDVGVVQLTEPLDLVHGFVSDEKGAPVRGIQVTATSRVEDSHTQRFGGWTEAISDAGGAFTVRGWLPDDFFNVQTLRESYNSANQPWIPARLENVPRGARDVTLVLRATEATSIPGRLLVDDPEMLRVLSIALDGKIKEFEVHRPEFKVRPVSSGSHTLSIHRDFYPSALLTLEGLEVRAGEACTDPRLDPIDLRGQLHWLEARLENADGTPFGNMLVHARYANGAVLAPSTDRNGRLRLLYVGEAPKLEILTPSGSYVPFDPGAVVRME